MWGVRAERASSRLLTVSPMPALKLLLHTVFAGEPSTEMLER